MTQYIGIDYSYTSPAICILGNDFLSSQFYFANAKASKVFKIPHILGYQTKLKAGDPSVQRYQELSLWALDVIRPHWTEDSRIVLEGYAFGAKGGLLFNIAENAGLLKYHLYKHLNHHPYIISPTEVKKFWSGKGNANKEVMTQTLKVKEGVDIVTHLQMKKLDSPAHDIVDSYAIALAGKHALETINSS